MFWGGRGYSAGYADGHAAGAKANQKPWTEIRDDGYGNPYTVHMPGGYYCRNVTEEEEEDERRKEDDERRKGIERRAKEAENHTWFLVILFALFVLFRLTTMASPTVTLSSFDF
jgi:hypothetical protein